MGKKTPNKTRHKYRKTECSQTRNKRLKVRKGTEGAKHEEGEKKLPALGFGHDFGRS